ncbi:Filament-like plant protein [Quillaja saponaria]|uniref:Filament-like plant protein n=1 Tax=Quillaja saponaria TaxID=32244 RepID=A0AAD7KQH4_QUISA|nr:Filament-like plant protein [Quillaja saponaria]
MDRRGWPWKKKSSDKTTIQTLVAETESIGSTLASLAYLGDQEKSKKVNYVQISMESYTHMSGLEDQVKDLEEKLFTAHSEINTKDNLVQQHAKVAEEAVSGWEKADAEAIALKHQLESLTLMKLTADDRASQLDAALKECMRQIRNVKEESEQKLQDAILSKTKQWANIKLELEAKTAELERRLLQAAAENAYLSRSLQEHSNMITKIHEEKSQAEAEIFLLKKNIQSYEKEISSVKYEMHIVSKELDIRNEENKMCLRSAEVANKQHLEDVRKIGKLEAESQRLRSLMRKKLPGPAALAQMKLEVDSLGQDTREPYLRRTAVKNDNLRLFPSTEFAIDNPQKFLKASGFLTARLMAMEEETKMLKEALAERNNELQASRNLSEKAFGKVKSLEAQLEALNQERSSPKSSSVIYIERSSSQITSNPPSGDRINEEGSPAESCTSLISNLSQLRQSCARFGKNEDANCVGLMDDFPEMEKLACFPENVHLSVGIHKMGNEFRINAEHKASHDAAKGRDVLTKQWLETDSGFLPYLKLQSMVSVLIDSQNKESNFWKVFEDVKCAMHEIEISSLRTFNPVADPNDASCRLPYIKDIGETLESDILVTQNGIAHSDLVNTENQDLCSNSEVLQKGKPSSGSESNLISPKCSFNELEQMKSEKDDKGVEHNRYMQDIEKAKLQLEEREEILAELKIQLASSKKSYSLAEIQLKCMTESYRSLETNAQELEGEVKILKEKIEDLQNELLEEKRCHQDALATCNDIQEKMLRNNKCFMCASTFVEDSGLKTRKQVEIVAAEKKLSECQETVYLLGRQLQALCPQIDVTMSQQRERLQMDKILVNTGHGRSNSHGSCHPNEFDQTETDSAVSMDMQGVSGELSSNDCNSTSCLSETEVKQLLSSSASSSQQTDLLYKSNSPSSAPAEQKQSRRFHSLFSSKTKTGHTTH